MSKRQVSVKKQLAEFPAIEHVRFVTEEEEQAISSVGYAFKDLCERVVAEVDETLKFTEWCFYGGADRGATFDVSGRVYMDPLAMQNALTVTRHFSINLPATKAEMAVAIEALKAKIVELKVAINSFMRALILASQEAKVMASLGPLP